jgi:hypothetical protein
MLLYVVLFAAAVVMLVFWIGALIMQAPQRMGLVHRRFGPASDRSRDHRRDHLRTGRWRIDAWVVPPGHDQRHPSEHIDDPRADVPTSPHMLAHTFYP